MTVQTFIEKAIEGGWNGRPAVNGIAIKQSTVQAHISLAGEFYKAWFLDPEAWKAVGKVEGWLQDADEKIDGTGHYYGWKHRMSMMIDHLAEGGTITSYLETL